jgi:antitoxin FitA
MTAITIHDVPDHIRDELAARARRSRRSVQEYLLEWLGQGAATPDQDEWIRKARERARDSGSTATAEDVLSALREIRGA